MESRSKSRLVFVLLLLVGVIVGLAIGWYGGARFGMSFVLDECLYKDAKEVQTQVAILRHFRADERDIVNSCV